MKDKSYIRVFNERGLLPGHAGILAWYQPPQPAESFPSYFSDHDRRRLASIGQQIVPSLLSETFRETGLPRSQCMTVDYNGLAKQPLNRSAAEAIVCPNDRHSDFDGLVKKFRHIESRLLWRDLPYAAVDCWPSSQPKESDRLAATLQACGFLLVAPPDLDPAPRLWAPHYLQAVH